METRFSSRAETVITVNCQHNEDGAWCRHPAVKRSLFGFGARCCVEYPRRVQPCEFRLPWPRPPLRAASYHLKRERMIYE